MPAARPRTTRPRSPRPRRHRPWRTALVVVAVTATLGACGPVGAGPPGAGADGAGPGGSTRPPSAASDALQERADAVFESFAGTARQREAGGLLRAWARNGGMDTCLAAEGFPEWDWSAAHAAEPPTDALGTSVWFAAPLSHRYSDGLRATVRFLGREEALRSAEPSAREDAAIGQCLSAVHPAADSEVEQVSAPPEARRLSEEWWAMLAGWDEAFGDAQAYDDCFRERAAGVIDLPEGVSSWRAELTRHAPRPDDVPGPDTNAAAYTTSWRDFLALEASLEEADWACRADVYAAHLDDVAADVEAFARAHATEIDAAARGWDDVVRAAAGLPDPLAGS